jgi:hypothetical protein
VVWVAPLPEGKDDDAWAQAAQDCGDFEAVGARILDVAVGEVERLTMSDAEDAGGFGCLAGAISRCAARTGLTLGEVKDAGAPAERLLHEQRAAAGLLDVVAVWVVVGECVDIVG